MSKVNSVWLVAVLGLALAGCNTTRGIGQDIEATGEIIEETAEETREKLQND